MSTYNYLKPETETVESDVDLLLSENMALMQVGDTIDVWSPLAATWLYGSVIKAGVDWIETMMGGLCVVYHLDDATEWIDEGFDIRSSAVFDDVPGFLEKWMMPEL